MMSHVIARDAIERIAELEAELKRAKADLARVTKERDEILAMLREVTFRGNFAPNDYELELRACETIRMLDPERKGGGA